MNGWGLAAATALAQLVGETPEPLRTAAGLFGLAVERAPIEYGQLTRIGTRWVILLGDHLSGGLLDYVLAHELAHFLRGPGLAEYQRRHAADGSRLARMARLNWQREEADAHSFACAWFARHDPARAEQVYDLQRVAFCERAFYQLTPRVAHAPEYLIPVRDEGRVYGRLREDLATLTAPQLADRYHPWYVMRRRVWGAT